MPTTSNHFVVDSPVSTQAALSVCVTSVTQLASNVNSVSQQCITSAASSLLMTSEAITMPNRVSLPVSTTAASPTDSSVASIPATDRLFVSSQIVSPAALSADVITYTVTPTVTLDLDQQPLSARVITPAAQSDENSHIRTPESSTVEITSATLLTKTGGLGDNNSTGSTINSDNKMTSAANDDRQPLVGQTRTNEKYTSVAGQTGAQTFRQLLEAPLDQNTDTTWSQPPADSTGDVVANTINHSLGHSTDDQSMNQSDNHVTSDARLTVTAAPLSSKPATFKQAHGGGKYDVYKKRAATKPSTESPVATEPASVPIKDKWDQFKKQMREVVAEQVRQETREQISNQRPPVNASDAVRPEHRHHLESTAS